MPKRELAQSIATELMTMQIRTAAENSRKREANEASENTRNPEMTE